MAEEMTRIDVLTEAVLQMIKDRFQGQVDQELWMTCPIDGSTDYAICPDDRQGEFFLTIDGQLDADNPEMEHIPSLDLAKEKIASLIAERIFAAETLLLRARRAGIDLDRKRPMIDIASVELDPSDLRGLPVFD